MVVKRYKQQAIIIIINKAKITIKKTKTDDSNWFQTMRTLNMKFYHSTINSKSFGFKNKI